MRIELDVAKVAKRLGDRLKDVQHILDNQVMKDSNYYAPMDTGTLMASVITATKLGSGTIEWNTPYAHKLYYGVNYNFSKDSNPHARAKWFEEAKAKNMRNWEKIINANY